MDTFIGVIGTAFAAFAVWLTVRIINRRESWAIVLAVFTSIVGGFVALFGYLLYLSAGC